MIVKAIKCDKCGVLIREADGDGRLVHERDLCTNCRAREGGPVEYTAPAEKGVKVRFKQGEGDRA